MDGILSPIEERLDEPSAKGLAHAVSQAIRDGLLSPGTRLPPIREVAHELALSPTTVSAAWALLRRSGMIHTDGRRGTKVARTDVSVTGRYQTVLERQAPFELDLSAGGPDPALLPSLSRAIAGLDRAGAQGSYLDQPDLPELVEVLGNDWPYRPENLTMVDGAMDAMQMIVHACLRFGDRVVVEHPAFTQLLDLLETAGVRIIGVPLDDEGVRLDELRAAFRTPVAAVFLQPRAQNPTGVSLSQRRARAIAKVVRGTSTVVVEDDSSGMISLSEPTSLGRWLPDQTLHIRSFSKSHGPDIRLAALSAPAGLLEQVTARRQLGQGWSSRLLQRILLNLLTDPASIREVSAARTEHARRRTAIVTALHEHGVRVGGCDGMNIWVPVHDESAAIMRLASQGICVTPGAPFAVLPDNAPHIRVTSGLIKDHHAELAERLAVAARTDGRRSRGR
ncbi:PLP-dependent aminotransferase family protein [Streptomyces sp. OE57]|uniref:aminotransferase-like domain-containing protein n=1 Tax=Streptomyces lacaronensis TaxID=3379885 RepID=UPI0039B77584